MYPGLDISRIDGHQFHVHFGVESKNHIRLDIASSLFPQLKIITGICIYMILDKPRKIHTYNPNVSSDSHSEHIKQVISICNILTINNYGDIHIHSIKLNEIIQTLVFAARR